MQKPPEIRCSMTEEETCLYKHLEISPQHAVLKAMKSLSPELDKVRRDNPLWGTLKLQGRIGMLLHLQVKETESVPSQHQGLPSER